MEPNRWEKGYYDDDFEGEDKHNPDRSISLPKQDDIHIPEVECDITVDIDGNITEWIGPTDMWWRNCRAEIEDQLRDRSISEYLNERTQRKLKYTPNPS